MNLRSNSGRQLMLSYSPRGSSFQSRQSLQNAPFPTSSSGGQSSNYGGQAQALQGGQQQLEEERSRRSHEVQFCHLDSGDLGEESKATGQKPPPLLISTHDGSDPALEPALDQFPFALDNLGEGQLVKSEGVEVGRGAGGDATPTAANRPSWTAANDGQSDEYSRLLLTTLTSLGGRVWGRGVIKIIVLHAPHPTPSL